MKDTGLKLLLLFALGALKDKKASCHNPALARKVVRFLQGEKTLAPEIKAALPEKMAMAWRVLSAIAKKLGGRPLDAKNVRTYVLGERDKKFSHTYLAVATKDKRSAVFAGRVIGVDLEDLSAIVETANGEYQKIFFIEPRPKGLAKGGWVAFHHGYFVCFLTESGAQRLNKMTIIP